MAGASLWSGNTTQVSTANADSTKLEQRFTPTEGQSLFTLTTFSYALGTHSLEVFINGVRQVKDTDFTETSISSFTITGGVEASDTVDAVGIIGTSGAITAAFSATSATASAASAAASLAALQLLVPAALPLAIANGGTGKITRQEGLNAIAGLVNKGDILVFNGLNALRLPVGTTDNVLIADAASSYGVKWGNSNIPQLINTAGLTLTAGNYILAGNYSFTPPDFTLPAPFILTQAANATSALTNFTTVDGWTVSTGFTVGATKTITAVSGSIHGWWGSNSTVPKVTFSTNTGFPGWTSIISATANINATAIVALITDVTNNNFVLCFDPTTGLMGVPVQLVSSNTSAPATLYATGTNSFVAFYTKNTGIAARAGTIAGNVISLGAELLVSSGLTMFEFPVQVSPLLYVVVGLVGSLSPDLTAISINAATSVITAGAAVSSGSSTGAIVKLALVNATTVFLAYINAATAGAVTGKTVSIAGTVLTVNAGATSVNINNVNSSAANNVLMPFGSGSNAFLFGSVDYNTATSTNYNVFLVTGITTTVGNVTTQTVANAANSTFSAQQRNSFAYKARTPSVDSSASYTYFIPLDANRILVASSLGALYVATRTGISLALSAATSFGSSLSLLTDVLTGNNIYAVSSAGYSKITIAGAVITAEYTLATNGAVNTVFSDVLTDKTVNYAGIWYAWTGVPAAQIPLSQNKYVTLTSWPTVTSYGNFT